MPWNPLARQEVIQLKTWGYNPLDLHKFVPDPRKQATLAEGAKFPLVPQKFPLVPTKFSLVPKFPLTPPRQKLSLVPHQLSLVPQTYKFSLVPTPGTIQSVVLILLPARLRLEILLMVRQVVSQ